MGNPTTFSDTLGFWLQAAPWEPWQPLRLLALQRKIQLLALCKGICVLLMGNPTTFSDTQGFWLQAAPWESWQPLGLWRFREKSEFWPYVKGSAFCLWEILLLFGHPMVLAPGCSLGSPGSPWDFGFSKKNLNFGFM